LSQVGLFGGHFIPICQTFLFEALGVMVGGIERVHQCWQITCCNFDDTSQFPNIF
jgi:hypothetical protein